MDPEHDTLFAAMELPVVLAAIGGFALRAAVMAVAAAEKLVMPARFTLPVYFRPSDLTDSEPLIVCNCEIDIPLTFDQ
jgi:hypothetical protein